MKTTTSFKVASVTLVCLFLFGLAPMSLHAQEESTSQPEYTFNEHYTGIEIEALHGKTIKRIVPSGNGKYLYILAHAPADENGYKEPTLIVYDHDVANPHVVRELKSFLTPRKGQGRATTQDISTIGNIDVTEDGYLIAITLSIVPAGQPSVGVQIWENAADGAATGTSDWYKGFDVRNGPNGVDQPNDGDGVTTYPEHAYDNAPLPANGSTRLNYYRGSGEGTHLCGEAFTVKGARASYVIYYSSREPENSTIYWLRVGSPTGEGYCDTDATVTLTNPETDQLFVDAWPGKEINGMNNFFYKTTSDALCLKLFDIAEDGENTHAISSRPNDENNRNIINASINPHTPTFKHNNNGYIVGYNGTNNQFSLVNIASYTPDASVSGDGWKSLSLDKVTLTATNIAGNITTNVGAGAYAAAASDGTHVSVFLVEDVANGNAKIAKYSTECELVAIPDEVILLSKTDGTLPYQDVKIRGIGLTDAGITMTVPSDAANKIELLHIESNTTITINSGEPTTYTFPKTGGTLRVKMKSNSVEGKATGEINFNASTSSGISFPKTVDYTLIVTGSGIVSAPFLRCKGVNTSQTPPEATFTWKAEMTRYEVQKQLEDGSWETMGMVTVEDNATDVDYVCVMDGINTLTLRVRACTTSGDPLSDWSNTATATYSTSGLNLFLNYEKITIKDKDGNALLAGKTVKRVVPAKNTDYLYILAHHQDENNNWVPTLLCYNHKQRVAYELQAEVESGYGEPDKIHTTSDNTKYKPLSDIDVSDDGYVVGISEEYFTGSVWTNQNGACVYYWEPNENGVVESTTLVHPWFWAMTEAGDAAQVLGTAIAYTGNVNGTGTGYLYYTVDLTWAVRIVRYPITNLSAGTGEFNYYGNGGTTTPHGSYGLFLETGNGIVDGRDFILNETSATDYHHALNQYSFGSSGNSTDSKWWLDDYTQSSDTYENLFLGTTHTPIFDYEGTHYMIGVGGTNVAEHKLTVANLAQFNATDATPVSLNLLEGAAFYALEQNVDVAAATKFDEHNLGLFVVNGTKGTITKYSTTTYVTDVFYDCIFIGGAGEDGKKWSVATNWEDEKMPSTVKHNVLIKAPCEVDKKDAVANKIALLEEASYHGTLTILPSGALTLQGTVRNVTSTAVDALRNPINEGDLIVKADATSRGILAQFDETGTTKATVELNSEGFNGKWQYVAMPLVDGSFLDHFEGDGLVRYDYATNTWQQPWAYSSFECFEGYLLSPIKHQAYEFEGTLPAVTKQKLTLQTVDNTMGDADYGQFGTQQEYFIGNSWTAPLQIKEFELDDFVGGVDATIYLWQYQGQDENKNYVGHYKTYSIKTVPEEGTTPDETTSEGTTEEESTTEIKYPTFEIGENDSFVINPLQAFFVSSTGTTASSVILDPHRLIERNGEQPALNPYKKPRLANSEKTYEEMKFYVKGNDGFYADVRILQNEDYTLGFDNGYDGRKLRGDAAIPYLAAASEAGDMAILATPQFEGTYLNFQQGTGETYTLSFTYAGEDTYKLEDIIAQEVVEICTGQTYTFTPSADDNYRFRIIQEQKAPDTTTDISNVWVSNGNVYLTNPLGLPTTVTIYTVQGQMIERFVTAQSVQALKSPMHGVYIISVQNELGTQVVKCFM